MNFFSHLMVRAPLRWFRVWLILGICLIATVFYLSLTPVAVPQEYFDKLYHASTYALMMAWFVQLYRGYRSHLLLGVSFILMRVAIEVLQGFHPMRYFDVLDTLANAAGVLLVWVFANGRLADLLDCFERRVLKR